MSTKRLEVVEISKSPRMYYIPELDKIAVANERQGVVLFGSWYVVNKSRNHKKQTYLVKIDEENFHCTSALFGFTII